MARDNHYWNGRAANPEHETHYRYLTRSAPALEQTSPFDSRKGLEVWKSARIDIEDAKVLQGYLLKQGELSAALREYLGAASLEKLQTEFFTRFEWDTQQKPTRQLEDQAVEELILYGGMQSPQIPPTECERALESLVLQIIRAAISSAGCQLA